LRRGRSKKFRQLSAVLPGALRRLGLERVLAAHAAVLVWPEVAGAKTAEHCRAVAVDAGVLIVLVDSPAWSTQLSYLKPQLLKKLARRLGPGLIKDIRFALESARPGA